MTPLYMATLRRVVYTLDLLIRRGANIDSKNKKGDQTLLHELGSVLLD
jgi:ankyrin repeat protein